MTWFENERFWQKTYDFMFTHERFEAGVDTAQKLSALIGDPPKTVLDLCCGPGRLATIRLPNRDARNLGIAGPHLVAQISHFGPPSGPERQLTRQGLPVAASSRPICLAAPAAPIRLREAS